ncbi:hypothetical protein Pelo_16385 [Pelomyxa schiedti]|nr:hypothetical protein Pelo_16385 [Pelomyxa schiedti]
MTTTKRLAWDKRLDMYAACADGRMAALPPSPAWDINAPIDGSGHTLLHVACQHGHGPLVGQLLGPVGARRDPPVDPNTTDGDGMTPLCLAAWKGHEAVARMLAARPDVDVNKGCPLAIACLWRQVGVVVALLGCPRVDVNLVVKTPGDQYLNGQTALHVACEEGFVEGAKVLLKVCGIDANCKNSQGETPLDVATRKNCTDICNLLKAHNTSRFVQSSKPTTATPKNSTFELEMSEKEREIARITVENKRLGDSLREMNERVLILEGKLQEKEKRIQALEEENSVLKACYKERAETMTSLVGVNIDSFTMMKFLGSGSNAATFQVKFFPRGGGGCSSVPQLHHHLQPSAPSPSTTHPPLGNSNTTSDENNAPPTTMAMKVLFNWENTPRQTLIKQKYMKECIVLASVPLHPNVIHPLGTLVIPRFPPEFIDAIPSDQPVYREFALNKSLAFLLPFCGVPLVKFLLDVTARTVRNLLLQSLSAVAHLERAHVVHRDIKGDNILVDPATHKLTLIDFGEAVECSSTDDDELLVTVTRAENGQVWGNTGTMPPEVSALSRDLVRMRGPSCVFSFAKCDSFSLALTFYDAMLPPTNKFIGRFKQDMCTFTPELLPPLPPQWFHINSDNGTSTANGTTTTPHTTPPTTVATTSAEAAAPSNTTVVGTIAQALVGMMSRDRSTKVSAATKTATATSPTAIGSIAQVLVGMVSRDRATRLSASDALHALHSI